MLIYSVEFNFGEHSVLFVGKKILIQGDEGTLAEGVNDWTGKAKENAGVMNREHKPRSIDAGRLLQLFKERKGMFEPAPKPTKRKPRRKAVVGQVVYRIRTGAIVGTVERVDYRFNLCFVGGHWLHQSILKGSRA